MKCPYCGDKNFIEDRTIEESLSCHWDAENDCVSYGKANSFEFISVDNIRCGKCFSVLGVDFFTEKKLQVAKRKRSNNGV